MNFRSALILGLVIPLLGCQKPEGSPEPARIVDPGPESRARLELAIGEALGVPVTLQNDTFADSSELLLEPAARQGQNRLQGRDLGEPERFELLIHKGDCRLEHVNSGKLYPLPNLRCQAEP